jgi:phage gpG-like protein
MPSHKAPDTRTIILDDPAQLAGVYAGITISLHGLDFTNTWTDYIFPTIAQAERGYFANETGPDGQPWPQWYFRASWAPTEHPTLHVSGALEESLTGRGSGHIETVAPNEATYGTNVPYSAIHQEGATITLGIDLIGRGGEHRPAGTVMTIPARPHVGLTEQALDEICGQIGDAVIAQISAGRG